MFPVAQIKLAHDKVKSGADFPKFIQEIKKPGFPNLKPGLPSAKPIILEKTGFTQYPGAPISTSFQCGNQR